MHDYKCVSLQSRDASVIWLHTNLGDAKEKEGQLVGPGSI